MLRRWLFLLTRPSRDVTRLERLKISETKFLLTRPSRDVTTYGGSYMETSNISTHTPLAGRDMIAEKMEKLFENFYSHAPRGT